MPDFAQFFWATERKPLHFVTRDQPNLPHDIAFLSSYLHDAEFLHSSVKRKRTTVSIYIERDCWEIGYGHNPHLPNESELLGARAVLTIGPVASLNWRKPRAVSKLQIRSVYLAFESNQEPALIFAGGDEWQLRLSFSDTPRIELRDVEMPRSGSTPTQLSK
jgi:hypothetical protein